MTNANPLQGTLYKKLQHWNSRASLNRTSGTDDFLLQYLEEKLILEQLKVGQTVLDVGCGDGQLTSKAQARTGAVAVGIDFSPEMIRLAEENCTSKQVNFIVGNMLEVNTLISQKFDVIITKRSLINLDNFNDQLRAFLAIYDLLSPGGYMYCIENTSEGLSRLNLIRESLDLPKMEIPWHNRYFMESEIAELSASSGAIEHPPIEFASTYYLVSRVIYAKIAKDNGEELKYDSDLNLLSLQLPSIGDLGATRMFIFQKPHES